MRGVSCPKQITTFRPTKKCDPSPPAKTRQRWRHLWAAKSGSRKAAQFRKNTGPTTPLSVAMAATTKTVAVTTSATWSSRRGESRPMWYLHRGDAPRQRKMTSLKRHRCPLARSLHPYRSMRECPVSAVTRMPLFHICLPRLRPPLILFCSQGKWTLCKQRSVQTFRRTRLWRAALILHWCRLSRAVYTVLQGLMQGLMVKHLLTWVDWATEERLPFPLFTPSLLSIRTQIYFLTEPPLLRRWLSVTLATQVLPLPAQRAAWTRQQAGTSLRFRLPAACTETRLLRLL